MTLAIVAALLLTGWAAHRIRKANNTLDRILQESENEK